VAHEIHEVFGDNADYVLGHEARKNPTHPKLRALGRMARLFASDEQAERLQQGYDRVSGKLRNKIRELNQMRRAEKAERKAAGTIDFVLQHAAEADSDGMDQLMQIAAHRAKLQLEADLPPLADPNAPLPQRLRSPEAPQPPREFTHASAGSANAALDAFYEQYGDAAPSKSETSNTSAEEAFDSLSATRPPRSHRRRAHQPNYAPLHPASRGVRSNDDAQLLNTS